MEQQSSKDEGGLLGITIDASAATYHKNEEDLENDSLIAYTDQLMND